MLKTVRVPEKMPEQYTVLVGRETAEKLEKQTYSDAIKYLLGHHIVFPSKMVSRIEELIKNNELGYRSKEEFLYEAARQLLKYYSEDIESIKVRRHLYEKAKTAIEDLDLPFISVDDFVEEQLKNSTNNTTNGKTKKKKLNVDLVSPRAGGDNVQVQAYLRRCMRVHVFFGLILSKNPNVGTCPSC